MKAWGHSVDPRAILRPPAEAHFGLAIYEYARLKGWLAYHPYDSRRSPPGFPDWTLTRRGRLIFAELKIADDHAYAEKLMTDRQKDWRAALVQTAVEYFLWIPADWPQIVRVLE